ncbi:MAG: nuclear transport factor 2 family protein [Oceanococcus sp.]
MPCPACHHDNPVQAKFCVECGLTLSGGCSHCGAALAPKAKFCHECGTPVTDAAARPTELAGARKIVSILFADLVGSTALHERLDPESTRRFMEAYYDVARKAVESHGGKVTQFLGDGVKAVFGIPRIAEDDALRAVLAAAAMQEGFKALAKQQSEAVGSTGLRVAVNTGEVVDQGGSEIIGDPVNVAARLQEHGQDGDVVIGESTEHLVSTQVTLELLGAFDLKGRSGTVKAYRVVSLDPPQHAKLTPFVGREKELARLAKAYNLAVESPATQMAVLLGSAGLGKSRLIGEFARRSAATATVIQAHCDAAKGATFAPLADAMRKHLALDADASLEAMQAIVDATLKDDDDQARISRGILGMLNGLPASPEETFFVVRRFLAALTKIKPVVLIIDDLQWAEPLLLDLLEHLVQWGLKLPLLLLIGARPELRELRTAFGKTGGFVTDALTLDGLDAASSMQLAAGVIGADDLPAAVAAKVLASSEGNPLFISELTRMLVVEGALIEEDGEWRAGDTLATVQMPPTIHALLAARIERLDPLDCAILERAAVIGRQFSRNAVAALLPNNPAQIDARLEALQRFELIEHGTGWYIGDPVLRFHHVLIRDAAYRRLLKGSRAELHAQIANWIEAQIGDAHEYDETIGRHLEDAHRLLGELGPIDEAGEHLGERAASRLASAGRRALAADDVPLAASLLGRALERMQADHADRADLCIDFCEALLAEGEVSTAEQAIQELARLMTDSDRLKAWHQCFLGQHTVLTAPRELTATVSSVSSAALTLASLQDSAGEAKAHYVHALALSRQGQIGACEAALDQALAAARKADDRRQANTVLAIAPIAALWGPSPVTRASGRCLDVVRVLRITQGAPAVEAVALMCQGVLEALRGRSEAAHRMIKSGREMVEELGIAPHLRNADAFAGYVHLLEGDLPAAEEKLLTAYEGLRDLGLGIDAARAAALLAKALLAQGRSEEAQQLSYESEQLAGDDLKAAIAWRGVRAQALAQRGEHEDAIKLARKAVKIAASTDALLDHADARLALAVALRAAGKTQEADTEEQQACTLRKDKGAILLLDKREESADTPDTPDGRQNDAVDRPQVEHVLRPGIQYAPQLLELGKKSTKALAQRDFIKFRGLFHDDFREQDHSTGLSYGIDGVITSMRNLFKAENSVHKQEILGTLGSKLTVFKRHWRASGSTSKLMDVGAFEGTAFVVMEAGNAYLWIHSESFADNKLGDAIARLYERYAESLPEGPQRERALTIARSVKWTLTDDRSISIKEAITPDLQGTDHRPLVGHETVGHFSQRLVDTTEELVENLQFHLRDILALTPDALLRTTQVTGNWKDFGGEGEIELLMLSVFGPDGRQTQLEWFDPSQQDLALARFHELAGGESNVPAQAESGTALIGKNVRPNLASKLIESFVAAVHAGDFETARSTLRDDYIEVHHPTGLSYGPDENIRTFKGSFENSDPYLYASVVATLGKQLCLSRFKLGGSGGEAYRLEFGAFELSFNLLSETDEQGRAIHGEIFADEKLGEALARLYQRNAESLPEGLAQRWEQYDSEDVDHAIARYKEPCSNQDAPQDLIGITLRPGVQANAMTHFMEQFVDALKQRDFAQLRSMFIDSYKEIDHPTGSTIDKAGTIASLERLFRSQEPYYQIEVLATLGDALQLGRHVFGATSATSKNFDVGAYENVRIQIDDREEGIEVFDTKHLGDAVARLYERYAASLPEGPEQAKATGLAKIIQAGTGRIDHERLKPHWSGDVQLVDHRTAGMGSVVGRDAVTQAISVMAVELTEDFAGQFDEIVTLRPDALLAHYRTDGKGQLSGGEFEQLAWYLMIADEQGNIARWEIFDAEQAEAARARFEELTGDPKPGPVQCKVQPNLASKAQQDSVQAATKHNWAGLRACYAENYQETHHPTASTFGADESCESIKRLFASVEAYWKIEPVATLSSRLCLSRAVLGASGNSTGSRYDVGEYESHFLPVTEVDDNGLLVCHELFAENKLGEAFARLYQRYAESLPEGAERKRAEKIASWAEAGHGRLDDLDHFLSHLAEDIQAHDHRTAGYGELSGKDALRKAISVFVKELSVEFSMRMDDIYSLRPEGILVHNTTYGKDKKSGGKFERIGWNLFLFNAQGLVQRWEQFDPENVDQAIARFEELCPDQATQSAREEARPDLMIDRLPPGIAQITGLRLQPSDDFPAGYRMEAACNARDWATARTCFTDDYTQLSHPTGSTMGPDGVIEGIKSLFRGEDAEFRAGLIARFGDRLSLFWRYTRATGTGSSRYDVGDYDLLVYHVCELDEQGLMRRDEVFADNRLGDALANFYERYADSLPAGSERDRAMMSAHCLEWAATDSKKYAMEDVIAPDAKGVDHRLTGHGEVENYAQTYVASWKNLSRDRKFSIDDVLAFNHDGILRAVTEKGTWQETGGTFENEFLFLSTFGADGRGNRSEFFDIDKVDEALARFEELTRHPAPSGEPDPAPRRVIPNAASQMMMRYATAIQAQDWAAARACPSDEYQELHHPTGSTLNAHESVSSFEHLYRSDNAYYECTPLATLGNSICLIKGRFGASGGRGKRHDVGPYENIFLVVMEVNEQGQFSYGEVYSDNKLGDALACLYERFAKSLPEGPEQKRALTTARAVTLTLTKTTPSGEEDGKAHVPGLSGSARDEAIVSGMQGIDHRLTGHPGKMGDFDLRHEAAVRELASDASFQVKDVLGASSEALLRHTIFRGHWKEGGGEFEIGVYVLSIFGPDGRQAQFEAFEAGQEEKALARFDEATEGPNRPEVV